MVKNIPKLQHITPIIINLFVPKKKHTAAIIPIRVKSKVTVFADIFHNRNSLVIYIEIGRAI